jgi:hypothetical protein
MSELLKNLTDTSWWITVVVFGLLVNLASAYLKPILDSHYSRLSTTFRRRLDRRRDVRLSRLRALQTDDTRLTEFLIEMNITTSTATMLLVLVFVLIYAMSLVLSHVPIAIVRLGAVAVLGLTTFYVLASCLTHITQLIVSKSLFAEYRKHQRATGADQK